MLVVGIGWCKSKTEFIDFVGKKYANESGMDLEGDEEGRVPSSTMKNFVDSFPKVTGIFSIRRD